MANPLQAFVLTFALEGNDIVAKGLRKLTEQSDSLTKSLDKTDKSLSKTEKSAKKSGKELEVTAENFMQLATKASAAIAPLLALGVVLNRTLNFAKQGEDLLFMAQGANIAADKFQRLALATSMFGGSPQGTAGVLANLSGQLQDMRFGQGSAVQEAAIRYGFKLHGANGLATPEELLENVAHRFETLDTASQLDLGRMLGLDEPTIRLLQGGVSALRKEMELADKYTVFSKEDLENTRKFERTLREIKMGISALWAEVSRSLLPVFQKVGETAINIIDYFRKHSDFIKGTLLVVSAILTAIAIKTLAAFAPFFAIVGVLAAIAAIFALLYDDVMTFAKGGESALEPIWKIVKWVKELPDAIKEAVKAITQLADPLIFISKIIDNIAKLKELLFGGNLPNWQKKLAGTANEKNIMGVQELFGKIADYSWNSVGKGDISNIVNNANRKVNVENNITVNGGSNPAETAEAIRAEINPIFQMVTGAL